MPAKMCGSCRVDRNQLIKFNFKHYHQLEKYMVCDGNHSEAATVLLLHLPIEGIFFGEIEKSFEFIVKSLCLLVTTHM